MKVLITYIGQFQFSGSPGVKAQEIMINQETEMVKHSGRPFRQGRAVPSLRQNGFVPG